MDLSFLSDIETFRSNERDNAMLRKCLEDINSKYAISGFDKVQMDLFSSALLKSQKEVRSNHSKVLHSIQVEAIHKEEADIKRRVNLIDEECKEHVLNQTNEILIHFKSKLYDFYPNKFSKSKIQPIIDDTVADIDSLASSYIAQKKSRAINEIGESLDILINELEVNGENALRHGILDISEGWKPNGPYYRRLVQQKDDAKEQRNKILASYIAKEVEYSKRIAKQELGIFIADLKKSTMNSLSEELDKATLHAKSQLLAAEDIHENVQNSYLSFNEANLILDLHAQIKLLYNRHQMLVNQLKERSCRNIESISQFDYRDGYA